MKTVNSYNRQSRTAEAALPARNGLLFCVLALSLVLGLLVCGIRPAGAVPPFLFGTPPKLERVPLHESEMRGSIWRLTPEQAERELAGAPEEQMPEVEPAIMDIAWLGLVLKLEEDGFNRADMEELFSRLGSASWSSAFMAAKVTELHRVKGPALPTEGPAQAQLPDGYAPPVESITAGAYKAFLKEYEYELADIRKRFGVPANVLAGLLMVETGLGTNLGATPAFLALASMAATTTPDLLAEGGNAAQVQKVRANRLKNTLNSKSSWAYKELKALIAYGQDNDINVTVLPGSVYGAIGICQFMPSNIAAYGVDGDGDGVVNLFSVVDAMYSAANYLSEHGWRGAKSATQKQRVVMAYNQSIQYARKVLGVAYNLSLAEQGKLAAHRNPLAGQGRKTVTFRG